MLLPRAPRGIGQASPPGCPPTMGTSVVGVWSCTVRKGRSGLQETFQHPVQLLVQGSVVGFQFGDVSP